MKTTLLPVACLVLTVLLAGCQARQTDRPAAASPKAAHPVAPVVRPAFITDTTRHDTDDPAIWINPDDPARSLVLGTDKDEDGALYVYDLQGRIQAAKVVRGLKRPNNVDVAYGLPLSGTPTDIAVVTERLTHKLRVYALPSMRPVDGGGLPVFAGEPEAAGFRDLMGIALYTNPADSITYAIVGRKSGPVAGGYLWQYRLLDDGVGRVKAVLVRKFGAYSGRKEIESIAVDDALGFVYYSDETVGVRKYHADPALGDKQVGLFATSGFAQDHEGISIYDLGGGTGYLLVSDQQADRFHVFTREGHNQHLKTVTVAAHESDGSETTSTALGTHFPHGMLVAMSTDKTFHFYRWEDIAGRNLRCR